MSDEQDLSKEDVVELTWDYGCLYSVKMQLFEMESTIRKLNLGPGMRKNVENAVAELAILQRWYDRRLKKIEAEIEKRTK